MGVIITFVAPHPIPSPSEGGNRVGVTQFEPESAADQYASMGTPTSRMQIHMNDMRLVIAVLFVIQSSDDSTTWREGREPWKRERSGLMDFHTPCRVL